MPMTDSPQPLEAVKIDEQTYSIEDNGVRCLLFIGAKQALLIDSGFGASGSVKTIVGELTNKPIIHAITHADPDHTGGTAEFSEAHMHPSEMPYYFKNAKPDAKVKPLWEGDILDIGGRRFEIILIPGHTAGSIAFLDRENRVIVTGDSVSAGPVFMFGDERSLKAYIASMEKLKNMSGAFDLIYPAHGPLPLTPGRIDEMLASAYKLLAGELTPQEPPFPLPAKMYTHNGAGFFY